MDPTIKSMITFIIRRNRKNEIIKLILNHCNLSNNPWTKILSNALRTQNQKPLEPIGGHNQMVMALPLSRSQHLVSPINNTAQKSQILTPKTCIRKYPYQNPISKSYPKIYLHHFSFLLQLFLFLSYQGGVNLVFCNICSSFSFFSRLSTSVAASAFFKCLYLRFHSVSVCILRSLSVLL